MTAGFPQVRLRRYRQTESLRALTAAPTPPLRHFIWPVILVEGKKIKHPIPTMPGQHLLSVDCLLGEIEKLGGGSIGGVLLFAKIDKNLKSLDGQYSWDGEGLIQRAIRELKKQFPDLNVFTDVGLSGYTSHGNNGIIDQTRNCIDNDKSLSALTKIALSQAEAGADCVAPSAMVDGQVQRIRKVLDESDRELTMIMGYSAKFASDLYDTFPVWGDEVVAEKSNCGAFLQNSPLMQTYCTAPDNLNLALKEIELDVSEGADFIMVKPALYYLDIISEAQKNHHIPVAAYNVSGEYSMIHATAERGWGDLYTLARESLISIRRAGADILISYWANQYDKIFKDESF